MINPSSDLSAFNLFQVNVLFNPPSRHQKNSCPGKKGLLASNGLTLITGYMNRLYLVVYNIYLYIRRKYFIEQIRAQSQQEAFRTPSMGDVLVLL